MIKDDRIESFHLYDGSTYNCLNKLTLCKCLMADMKSPTQNYQWAVGKIHELTNTEKFRSFGTCEGGGLYFCSDLRILTSFANNLVGIVQVPDTAQVWTEDAKAKTDQLKLTVVMTNVEFVMRYLDGSIRLTLPSKAHMELIYLSEFVNKNNLLEMLHSLKNHSSFQDGQSKQKAFFNRLIALYRHSFAPETVLEYSEWFLNNWSGVTLLEAMILFHGNNKNTTSSTRTDESVTQDMVIAKVPANIHDRYLRNIFSSTYLQDFDNRSILSAMARVVDIVCFLQNYAYDCVIPTVRDILFYEPFVANPTNQEYVRFDGIDLVCKILYKLERSNTLFLRVIVSLFVYCTKLDEPRQCLRIVVESLYELGLTLSEVQSLIDAAKEACRSKT